MDIFQMAAIALMAVTLILAIRDYKPDIAMLLALGTGVFLLLASVNRLKAVVDAVQDFSRAAGMDDSFMGILFRITGIAYVTEFTAEVCRDAGANSVASKLELAGKIIILTMALPIMAALLELIKEFIK